MTTMRHFLLLTILTGCLSACSSTGPELAAPDILHSGATQEEYRIGVDDMVSVRVWRNEDLEVTAPVRPDGRISVPLIGDVDAAGRTTSELSQSIEDALGKFIRDPQVSVLLTELRSHEYLSRVRVTGAVRNPVSLPYRQGMTVLDAVLAAGGPTEFAAADRAMLHRKSGKGVSSHPVPLGSLLGKGDISVDLPVSPGDVITIPERIF